VTGFLLGLACVVRGTARLAATPALWAYAVAPIVATVVGMILLVRLAIVGPVAERVRAWLDGTQWLAGAATTLVWVAAVAAGFLAFSTVVRVVAAPFLALLADRTVADLSGRPTPAAPGGPLVRWVARPFVEAVLLLGIRLAVTVAALPLLLVPVAGGVAFSVVAMGLLGLDLLDLAQSARGVLLGARLRFAFRHLGACLGLGVGAGLLFLVPCVNLLLLPATVVAGVLLDERLSPDFRRATA
jgi:CysZ protein